jgi:hypothetical protein
MALRHAVLALAAPLLFSGCATVASGRTQSLSLNTQTVDGQPVRQADCTLKNDRGTWKAQSPAQVEVRKSDGDLTVECQKNGFDAGFARVISRVHALFVADALLWGVGALVDHATGSAYDYPAELSIKMGTSVVLDKSDESGEKKEVASAE